MPSQIFDIESEPGPYEIQYDEEWLAITRKFNSILPLTFKNANFGCVSTWKYFLGGEVALFLDVDDFVFWCDRDTQLGLEDCRQWVRSRLQERGTKPYEFARTVPAFDPSQPDLTNASSGGNANLVSFILLWVSACLLIFIT